MSNAEEIWVLSALGLIMLSPIVMLWAVCRTPRQARSSMLGRIRNNWTLHFSHQDSDRRTLPIRNTTHRN